MAHTSTVYLLHFDRPLAHARHYLGSTANLDTRLMEVVTALGIGFQLARTWAGGRPEERRLKRRKNSPRLCPICKGTGRVR